MPAPTTDEARRQRISEHNAQRRAKGKTPPPTQLRQLLAAKRAQGVAFDVAWQSANTSLYMPHDTSHKRDWHSVFADPATVEIWRCAYERDPLPELDCFTRVEVSVLA